MQGRSLRILPENRGQIQGLYHIHLSGINYGPKGEKNYPVMGKTDLNFKSKSVHGYVSEC
jgi:hypothetical protein